MRKDDIRLILISKILDMNDLDFYRLGGKPKWNETGEFLYKYRSGGNSMARLLIESFMGDKDKYLKDMSPDLQLIYETLRHRALKRIKPLVRREYDKKRV